MTRAPLGHSASELEPFFAAERELIAESEDLRHRVLERARASLQLHPHLPHLERTPKPRQVKFGLIAAAAVTLSAMCAAAYFAGYHARSQLHQAPDPVRKRAPGVAVQQVPDAPMVAATVPVTPADPRLLRAEPASTFSHSNKPTAAESSKVAVDLEAYTRELRLLQPARQAVARSDFGTALTSIADHQSQYPSGKLAEEREALRVKSLLGLGRTAEAQRAGASFRARFPRSVLLKRIDEMLAVQK